MAMVPGVCEKCGAVFGAEALTGAAGTDIQLGGAKIGPCPSCGSVGRVPEGTYDLIEDTLRVVQAATIEKGILDAVIEVLEDRAEQKVTDADVIERVEASAPALAPTVKDYLAKSDPATWLTLLVSVLAMVMQSSSSPPPSAEEIADAIWAKEHPAKTAKPKSIRTAHMQMPKTHGKTEHRKSRKRR